MFSQPYLNLYNVPLHFSLPSTFFFMYFNVSPTVVNMYHFQLRMVHDMSVQLFSKKEPCKIVR